jgi:hypothetical protein
LQGIKILDELKLKPKCSTGYLFLGELYANRGQPDKALENRKKSRRDVSRDGNGLLAGQDARSFGEAVESDSLFPYLVLPAFALRLSLTAIIVDSGGPLKTDD